MGKWICWHSQFTWAVGTASPSICQAYYCDSVKGISLCWLALQEEKAEEKVGEAKAVKLYGQIPPIEKMDASLSTLINCE